MPCTYSSVDHLVRDSGSSFFPTCSVGLSCCSVLIACSLFVSAACSQDASVLSFSRSLAATLSSALSSPLVLVCAYDHETEELYCCPASLSLHELLFSSQAYPPHASHRPNRLSSSPPASPRCQVPLSSSSLRGQGPGQPPPPSPAVWPGHSRGLFSPGFAPIPFALQSSPERLFLWGRGGPGPPPFTSLSYRAAAARQLGFCGVSGGDGATCCARALSPRVSFTLSDLRSGDPRTQERKRSSLQEAAAVAEDSRKILASEAKREEALGNKPQQEQVQPDRRDEEERTQKASKRRGFFGRRREKEKHIEKGASTVLADSSSAGETPRGAAGVEREAEREWGAGKREDADGKEEAMTNDGGEKPFVAGVGAGEHESQSTWPRTVLDEEDLIGASVPLRGKQTQHGQLGRPIQLCMSKNRGILLWRSGVDFRCWLHMGGCCHDVLPVLPLKG